jgi:predicted phage tail protein
MNRSIISFLVVGATAAWLVQPVLAAEPTTAADVSRQTSETWNTIKSYTVDKKSEAVAFGKQLMKDTDEKIAQLEVKASKASGEAKATYDKQIADLKVTRANTAAKLDEMEKKSGGAWNEAKQGFADAYKDLQRAYGKVVGQFK